MNVIYGSTPSGTGIVPGLAGPGRVKGGRETGRSRYETK